MRIRDLLAPHARSELRRRIAGLGLTAVLVAGGGVVVAETAVAQDDPPPRETRKPHEDGRSRHQHGDQRGAEERGAEAAERHADRQTAQEELAELLGLGIDDMRASLRSGSSLADLAEAAGVDRQVVIDHLVAEAEERLDGLVAAGLLTESQAEARSEKLLENAQAMVDKAPGDRDMKRRGNRSHRGHRGHHHHRASR